MPEIIRELTVVKKTSEITSEQMLAWVRMVEKQRAQKFSWKPQKTIKSLV